MTASPGIGDGARIEALAYIGLILVFGALPILITWRMGKRRGRHGWVWGLLLGWLGVLLLKLGLPPDRESSDASKRPATTPANHSEKPRRSRTMPTEPTQLHVDPQQIIDVANHVNQLEQDVDGVLRHASTDATLIALTISLGLARLELATLRAARQPG